jgi:uncharacterized damage-inducible protein DinB
MPKLAVMTDIDDHGRPEPPLTSDEGATLLGFLDYQRATFEWKCAGLGTEALATTIASSTMTLGGMIKHLALVEDYWFSQWLRGHESSSPWVNANWEADPDWDWHSATDNTPEELRALWSKSVETSRAMVSEALAEGDLGQLAHRKWPDGRSPNMRWILTHMIEEYARHNGHADLIRESIDGETGE